MIGGKCVAGATSCTMHIAAQTEDSCTKDDTGDWARNEVSGLSWDASTDALMLSTEASPQTRHENGDIDLKGGLFEAYFFLHPGEELTDVVNVTGDDDYEMNIYDNYTKATLQRGFINETTEDIEVMLLYSSETDGKIGDWDAVITNVFGNQLGTITNAMKAKRAVTVRFDYTRGTLNRETVTQLLEGSALITDVSVTAANRQNTTFSVQLTGTGELTMTEAGTTSVTVKAARMQNFSEETFEKEPTEQEEETEE